MVLGGVPIEDRFVLRLARLVGDAELASKLYMAYSLRFEAVDLNYIERHAILATLEQQPAGFEGLLERLVADYAWQLRQWR
jgi:hypothetical protein